MIASVAISMRLGLMERSTTTFWRDWFRDLPIWVMRRPFVSSLFPALTSRCGAEPACVMFWGWN